MNPSCIFCRIIAGQNPAVILFRDELVTAFRDIHPITPIHILVVPNQHYDSLNQIHPEDELMLGRMIRIAHQLAEQENIKSNGYRLVINTGLDSGQSVFHLHLHLLGGRHMPFRFN